VDPVGDAKPSGNVFAIRPASVPVNLSVQPWRRRPTRANWGRPSSSFANICRAIGFSPVNTLRQSHLVGEASEKRSAVNPYAGSGLDGDELRLEAGAVSFLFLQRSTERRDVSTGSDGASQAVNLGVHLTECPRDFIFATTALLLVFSQHRNGALRDTRGEFRREQVVK
jgi:hypothetical protein